MSDNQFPISGIWDPQPDPPEKLGQRMLVTSDALAGASPCFRNWRFMDHRAAEEPFEIEKPEHMAAAEAISDSLVAINLAEERAAQLLYSTARHH